MGLEAGTYISDLVATNPTSGDAKTQGDDHLRLIKSTVKATFPNVAGAVSATHTQLSYLGAATGTTGTTSSSLVFSASPTFTGTLTAATITASGDVSAGATQAFVVSGRARITANADGQITLFNTAGTSFGGLLFGGITSAFPAIFRNLALLDVKLADGSAYTGIQAKYFRVIATTVASLPTAASVGAGAKSFVTDANATTFASIVAGGGANGVPVYSDGTNWRIG